MDYASLTIPNLKIGPVMDLNTKVQFIDLKPERTRTKNDRIASIALHIRPT